ncbi:RNA polymerase sigma factor [Roseomonas populi]|uniref:Sigma-70 family RNA polymerase sigma factor n=1 Tax=Roseomonas populi TaxID=3121582 RepID=A0ABT1X3Z3_9PROT|nr:sigma-70 family RNA polymerase sigma factor [Roseomonas pecuniae]MCR0982825.1 sigma-70 family RNA polymerase sigma factor [Roseomonas pecuniae]
MRDRHAMLARHGDRLHRYARVLTGDRDAAQDLWQETAARYLAARRAPAEETEARLYLFRSLRNLFIDQARHRRVTRAHAEEEGALRDPPEADARSLIAEITVRQALARLAPEQRDLVALVDIGGFAYVEAAALLGIPVGTVMSRLARARTAMLADIAGSSVVPIRKRAS